MRTLAAMLLLAGFALPLKAQGASSCTTPTDACRFFERFLDALNRRDWQAFRATFAENITVMFDSPEQPARKDGRVAVEAMFRPLFPAPDQPPRRLPPPLRPADLQVQDLGTVAIVTFHLRAPDEISRRTVVLSRAPDGWRVVHIHASSFDVPPAHQPVVR